MPYLEGRTPPPQRNDQDRFDLLPSVKFSMNVRTASNAKNFPGKDVEDQDASRKQTFKSFEDWLRSYLRGLADAAWQ